MAVVQHQRAQPSRAGWLVPLGLGLSGPLLGIFIAVLGFGYDLFLEGRTPHPFVLWGIGMLCLPFLSISRNNYRVYQEEREDRELPRPSRQVLREIAASMQRHAPELVEQAVVVAMAQLDRLKDERYIPHDAQSFRSTTIRQLGRGAQKEDHDVDGR